MVEIAILAKAPIPGLCKTRLIPALGAQGAADLHNMLLRQTVMEAVAAAIGPVVLWCMPDFAHPVFRALSAETGVRLAVQPNGDLGDRMHQAIQRAAGPCLVIGTDCPLLNKSILREAADILDNGANVMIPAEDGGYVAIGLRQPQLCLFQDMEWSTDKVALETRKRAVAFKIRLIELPSLWDVDVPADLDRLRQMIRWQP